jgi:hypothetical protein
MSEQAQQQDLTPGIVSWNELATNDPEGSKTFYTRLFGWTPETMPMGPGASYTFFNLGKRPAGGMIQMPPEAKGAPTMWMCYVTVAHLDVAVVKAKELGARLVKDITPLPMGRFAIIADPQGAVIGLWEFAQRA